MIAHPNIDPVAFQVFSFSVHWYGLMYLLGFLFAATAGQRLLKRPMFSALCDMDVADLIVAASIGVIIGGRLGYVLFYNTGYYYDNPTEIVHVWKGGMSFHGGLLGVILSITIYAKMLKLQMLRLMDFCALLVPPGLGLGRIGNFIGGELPGRVASPNLPWAMIFKEPDSLPRHPSQIYQAFLEGVVLLLIVYAASRYKRHAGWLAGVAFLSYGILRFISEFFREPDAQLGFIFKFFSMGQLLSLPMVFLGLILIFRQQIFSASRASGEYNTGTVDGKLIKRDKKIDKKTADKDISLQDKMKLTPSPKKQSAGSYNSPSGDTKKSSVADDDDKENGGDEEDEEDMAGEEIKQQQQDAKNKMERFRELSWDDESPPVMPLPNEISEESSGQLTKVYDWLFGDAESYQEMVHEGGYIVDNDEGFNEKKDGKGFLRSFFDDEEEEQKFTDVESSHRRKKRRKKKKKRI